MIRIVEWAPIEDTDFIPPFGSELRAHLAGKKAGRESYAAWKLLYQVLLSHDLPIGTVSFTSEGKPYFVDSQISISLAHTPGLCAVSVADTPTGIDVERTDRTIPPKVLKRALSTEEYEQYQDDPFAGWCRKEVAAKISGNGVLKESSIFTIVSDDIDFRSCTVDVVGVSYTITVGFL